MSVGIQPQHHDIQHRDVVRMLAQRTFNEHEAFLSRLCGLTANVLGLHTVTFKGQGVLLCGTPIHSNYSKPLQKIGAEFSPSQLYYNALPELEDSWGTD